MWTVNQKDGNKKKKKKKKKGLAPGLFIIAWWDSQLQQTLAVLNNWSQSYVRELQRRRCRNLQRHE
jgi:hypothetical protein